MKSQWARIGGALAIAALSSAALAQELDSVDSASTSVAPVTSKDDSGVLDGRYYVSPMFSYLLADSDRNTKDGLGGTLAFGKGITDNLALELSGFYTQADDHDSSATAKIYGYGASVLVFPRNQFRDAYGIISATFDQTKDHPGTPASFNDAGFDAGLGYLLPLGWLGASLRAEALFHMDSHVSIKSGSGGRNQYYDGLFNVGLFLPIGAAPQVAPPTAAPVTVVAVAPPPSDSDGDGVIDPLDQCPGTPPGTVVDSVGCPLKPPCKAPEPGEKITLQGCATGDVIVLHGVNFDFNKATLTVNAKTILDGVAEALQSVPAIKVEIGGYTDGIGSDAYNLKLSDRRAASVRQYLIGRGVDAKRMTSHGYGKTNPVADNATDEGRELNRRVELKIAP